jgi:hypothetical protein
VNDLNFTIIGINHCKYIIYHLSRIFAIYVWFKRPNRMNGRSKWMNTPMYMNLHPCKTSIWRCHNPNLAKCGGEAQHLKRVGIWSPLGLPNV